MKNNQLVKADIWQTPSTREDEARRLERALKIIRLERERELITVPDPGGFLLSCSCAVEDRGYVLRFKRNTAGGELVFAESVKLTDTASKPTGNNGASSLAVTFDLSEFEKLYFPCPWCGDDNINNCHCGLVCGGRTEGQTFHCRPSCGASWVGTPMKKIEGTSRRQEKRCMAAPPRPSPSTYPSSHVVQDQSLTLAGREPLRLPAGEKPAGRFDLLRSAERK